MEAKIWAIYRGLTIIFQKGTTEMEIASDSEQAINQILQGPSQNSPYKALIEDTKFLLQRCNCSLGHTLREGNKAVDKLASIEVAQDDHIVILEDPPPEVTPLIIDDMCGVSVVVD
ncbi:unnamed protein product [Camellia sinensis]